MTQKPSISAKASVLICPSYLYRYDEKQWQDQKPYPPYGTLVAAACLKSEGYSVTLFDTHLANKPSEIFQVLDSQVYPNYLVIYDDGFNYLTKMCLSVMRDVAFEMIDLGKKANCKIIVCSSDATDHHESYLKRGANFVIHGEGEITLLDLMNSLESGQEEFGHISGISYLQNGTIRKNPMRPVIRELDSLPDAAWDLIDIAAYKKIWKQAHGYFSLNIATTRGCPFKCNWCAKPIYGNKYNSRSAQRVVKELMYLVAHHQLSNFWMADDIFGLNLKWLEQFRNEIIQAGLKIQYKIQSRADLLMQEKYIDLLKESGCAEVWIGAESGSQKVLDAMDKGITVTQIKESTRLLQSKNIKVGYFLQFGYIGETLDDIKSTIKMLLTNMPDDMGISVSYPLPGTLFYEKVKSQLRGKQNWVDSDDLAMMYSGSFSAGFYKRLHRLVHKLFRLKQNRHYLSSILIGQSKISTLSIKQILSIPYYFTGIWVDRLRIQKMI